MSVSPTAVNATLASLGNKMISAFGPLRPISP